MQQEVIKENWMHGEQIPAKWEGDRSPDQYLHYIGIFSLPYDQM
jgi:hypothetical protein